MHEHERILGALFLFVFSKQHISLTLRHYKLRWHSTPPWNKIYRQFGKNNMPHIIVLLESIKNPTTTENLESYAAALRFSISNVCDVDDDVNNQQIF